MHSGIRMFRPPRTRSIVDAVLTKERRLLITGGACQSAAHPRSQQKGSAREVNE